MRPAKRIHPKAASKEGEIYVNETASITNPAVEATPRYLDDDEFWDYDRQIDVEGFTANRLYQHLNQQGHTVLTGLSKQKQEAKSLYMKVADQNENLKGLWVAKMRLKGEQNLILICLNLL